MKCITKGARQDTVLSEVLDYILYGSPMKVTEDVKPYETNKNEYSVMDCCILWRNRTVISHKCRQ
jgi:hypothetical protein